VSSTVSAASSLDAYMRQAMDAALSSIMPDWKNSVFGTAQNVIADVSAVSDRFKAILPDMMAQVNKVSTQALSVVSSMLQGDIPKDVADQVARHAAEIGNQIGVRGQAAKYLTARDLGRTSLDLISTGLQAAPVAAGLSSAAYTGYQTVLGAPLSAANTTAGILQALSPKTTDAASLFANLTQLATNQSQFGSKLAFDNYWQQVTQQAGERAANVAQASLDSASDFRQQLLDLQKQQLTMSQNLKQSAVPTSTAAIDWTQLVAGLKA
jgi:hypothetical protein